MGDVTRQNVDGYTLLSYLKRGLMDDASGPRRIGLHVAVLSATESNGLETGELMAGRLPSSVYEAGFHLSSHYTSRLTVLLSDGKGGAVR